MAGKTTPKKRSAPPNTARKKQVGAPAGGSQAASILLFFVSVLIFLFAVIPGSRVWNEIHMFLHGVFGFTAYIFPLLCMFVTVYCAFKRPVAAVKRKFVGAAFVLWFFAAFIDVLHEHTADFGVYLGEVYKSENVLTGGVMGAVIGWPFQNWFSTGGAAVILAVIIIVLLLLVTGTTLVEFIRPMIRPAKKVRDNTALMIERRRAAEEARRRSFDVSIEGMPDEPINPPKHDPADIETKKDRLITSYHAEDEDVINENPGADKAESGSKAVGGKAAGGEGSVSAGDSGEDTDSQETQNIDDIINRLKNQEKPASSKQNGDKQTGLSGEKAESSQDKEDSAKNKKDDESDDGGEFVIDDTAGKKTPEVYIAPGVDLLDSASEQGEFDMGDELKQNADLLINTLRSFGVEARIINISRGPSVTRYELQPAAGVKISKITNLADDIALNLATAGVRIEAPIPNKAAIGIEVPNKKTAAVNFRDVIDTEKFANAKSKLTAALGKDIAGNVVVADLTKMPHILIAGTTGSGKSVCVNSMIMSVLFKSSPEDVKLLMIDPKVVELQEYNGIPHLLVPVVTDPRKAAGALGWAVTEMLRRYKTFAQCNVRDISSYNEYAKSFNNERELSIQRGDEDIPAELDKMPHILIIIEELADLMMAAPNEVEDSICRLAQMARAAGMHLVIATQRPSVDVVTGLIKANIPSRIALKTSNQFDSRTIIDTSGAEKLLGHGDMLFFPVGANKPTRIQGCWVSPQEIARVIAFLKKDKSADYSDSVVNEIDSFVLPEKGVKKPKGGEDGDFSASDELLDDAIECVVEAGIGSVSLLQRKLQVGHSRSGRLMDLMEERGIVGPFEGSKPRKVLITKQQWLEMKTSGVNHEDE